jgi:tetratricopeptide (TPR) repeat protein
MKKILLMSPSARLQCNLGFPARGVKLLRNLSVISAGMVVASLMTGCNLGVQQHNVAGRQAFETGQVTNAINEFQQAIQLDPRSADAYYNLGASYYALGKQSKNEQTMKQAESLYRQAIALNDQHVDAHRGLAAVLIETNQEKYAFDLMNTWKRRYPNSPEPDVELARLYQEYGDSRRATDLLTDALRLDNRNVRALKAMGQIRETQGQTHLALDNYLRVLQIDSRETAVAQRVATLQTQLAQLPVDPNQSNQSPSQQPRYGSVEPYLPR